MPGAQWLSSRKQVPRAVRTIGSESAEPGRFSDPHAIAIDSTGRVYVADRGNQRMQWFTTAGEFLGEYVVAGEAPPTPAGWRAG